MDRASNDEFSVECLFWFFILGPILPGVSLPTWPKSFLFILHSVFVYITLILMSGSCHLDRASNDEFSVECLFWFFILGPILPGVSLPTWPKSWTTFTGQTAQVTSFILLFITPEYLKWWATAYPLFLLLLPSAYCLPFGNSIFFNLY